MRTSVVVGVIAGLHCVLIGSVILYSGCGRTTSVAKPKPEEIRMPPVEPKLTPPVFQPGVTRKEQTAPLPQSGDLQTYVVAKGDCLSAIAQRHGITTREMMDLNGLASADKISVGQKLLLPAHAKLGAVVPVQHVTVAPEGMEVYTVAAGDCLSKIAVTHFTTIKSLRDANKLTSDNIYVGEKLFVPQAKVPRSRPPADTPQAFQPKPVAEVPKPDVSTAYTTVQPAAPVKQADTAIEETAVDFVSHEVEAGETLDQVAMKYGVSAERLMAVNKLNSRSISAGMILKIPQDD